MVICLTYFGLFAIAMTSAQPQVNPALVIGRSSELFAAKVYQELKTQRGNLLICPISVQTVLALVQAGANGDTYAHMQRALLLPEDQTAIQSGFRALMQSLQSAEHVAMDIANRVYINEDVKINPVFKAIATDSFAAGIENVDFANGPKSAAQINEWVESKTNHKIRNLVSPNMITAATRMILVNALYFKGKWASQFETWATRPKDFFVNDVQRIEVPMMQQTGQFNYAENTHLDCKFLEMPYEGGEFAMTIVLPNQRTGLRLLEDNMHKVLAPQAFTSERVKVLMPKFSMETKIEFNEVLKKLGMASAFSDAADFKNLTANGEALKISDVIQKNFINVTEQGTEAASATAVHVNLIRPGPPQPPPREFAVDRPFIFCLHQKLTNTLLFIGKFTQE